MTLVGIDEAGKGPCIGPMVVAGVSIEPDDEKVLAAMGVKDSKLLSVEEREKLYDLIKKMVKSYHIEIVQPQEIDEALYSPSENLLTLETKKMGNIIRALEPKKVILDCPSTNIKNFTVRLQKLIPDGIETYAAFKADEEHPVVGAASILAKVVRDREIEKLKEEFQVEFGSGYASDPRTKIFIEEHWNNELYAPIFRKSWETWKQKKRAAEQSQLEHFGL